MSEQIQNGGGGGWEELSLIIFIILIIKLHTACNVHLQDEFCAARIHQRKVVLLSLSEIKSLIKEHTALVASLCHCDRANYYFNEGLKVLGLSKY